jgi:hypothetical protein
MPSRKRVTMLKISTVVAVAVLVAGSAGATVLVPVDLADLSREARWIVRGRVADTHSRWADDHRRIETLVTLEPELFLKGAPSLSIEFTVPGGQLGRYRSIVIGVPQLAPGQRLVVFLGARTQAAPYVLGWIQGVFRIAETAGGPIVTAPAGVRISGSAAAPVGTSAARLPLSDFERVVRDLAGGAR